MLESDIFSAIQAAASVLPEDKRVTFWRMETHGAPVGMADVLYAGRGTGGVLELKVIHTDALDSVKVPYRPGQRSFLVKHGRDNPHTFVLLYVAARMLYVLIPPSGGFPSVYMGGIDEIYKRSVWCEMKIDEKFFDCLSR